MKILTITSHFPRPDAPDHGTRVLDRLRALRDRGAEIRVISPKPMPSRRPAGPATDEVDGFPVSRPRTLDLPLIGTRWQAFGYARGIRKALADEIRHFAPDVLDVHGLYPDGAAVIAAAKRTGLPVAVTALGPDVKRVGRYPAIHVKLRAALPRAAAVIATTEDLARALSGQNLYRGQVHVVADGVDRDLFHESPREAARERLSLPPDRPIGICVGNLGRGGGQETALAALAAPEAPAGLVIHFLGDGAERGRLERLARVLKLGDRAVFHGRVAREQVPLWLAAADVALVLGRPAGTPTSLLEALAVRTPVLAADHPALKDVLPLAEHGRLVTAEPVPVAKGLAKALAEARPAPEVDLREWNATAEDLLVLYGLVATKPPRC